MKIIFLFLLLTNTAFAQIGDVVVDNNYAKIYDENGRYSGRNIYLGGELIGYNDHFIIIKDGKYAKIYDEGGRYTNHYIYLGSNWVKNVTPNSILVREGKYIRFYDFKGRTKSTVVYDN